MSLRRRSDRKRATVGMRKRKCTRECTELSLQPARVGQRVARSSCNMRAQKNIHEIEPAAEAMGTWCSGITSAPHAEGPGFNPQCVHIDANAAGRPRVHFTSATPSLVCTEPHVRHDETYRPRRAAVFRPIDVDRRDSDALYVRNVAYFKGRSFAVVRQMCPQLAPLSVP